MEESRLLKEQNRLLREENRRLRDELQRLRLKLYGIKPRKKRKKERNGGGGGEASEGEPKKMGPPRGHKGVSRKKPSRVDRVVVHELRACPDCGGELVDLNYHRERYVEDIVPARLFVTKHVIRHSYCSTCDKVVYPEVPEALGNHRFGIQFLLYITYLRYVLNLPYNKIARLLNDAYEAGVSEGALVSYIRLAARLFGPEYQRIKREMREMQNCHYDDTGQRIEGENRWLWVFINREAALYHSSKSRSKRVVVEILGEGYDGVTVQDFYPSYDGAPGMKQKDWAHLLRDARELAERRKPPPGAEELYQGLQGIYLDAREAVEKEKLRTRTERRKTHRRFVRRVKRLAEKEYEHPDVERLARRVLKYRRELFTFILIPGVEPTNNIAERALRKCVVQRKISGCHRTREGARNRDVLMSVIETMRLRGEDFLQAGREYISNTIT